MVPPIVANGAGEFAGMNPEGEWGNLRIHGCRQFEENALRQLA
jgi:hypothetical protein